MKSRCIVLIAYVTLAGCAADPANETYYDPLEDYEEIDATTVLDAPGPVPGSVAPERLFQVQRGEYLVELLGCGACHTDGALEGVPDFDKSLAGSRIGIAYNNPLGIDKPGVLYPPNITPDEETGIGTWSDTQIERAIRAGLGRHAGRRIAVMPWQGYAKITQEDVDAIVAYLRSIKPVRHKVPDEVLPGKTAEYPFVYFGVYRSRAAD
ncbi:MAG: c-type cytochrome [Woeseiaceae bacterium]|nr:c-type cytochrome [Woeseiaceae bacterium]NIP20831.1 c-type cytochrome [Woeseiaceae bacterium]NIS89624.1 c-type cytochrome [Woeseiaceae bacterium]